MPASRSDVTRVAGTRRMRQGARSLMGGGSRPWSREQTTAAAILFGPGPYGGTAPTHPATEAEAMGLPPFGRGVALLANAVASTDWYARRRTGVPNVWEPVPEQPSILTDPYPVTTRWAYKWAVTEDAILYGNTFALPGDVDWRTGRAGWLVPVPADDVWIATDPARPGWYGWVIGGASFGADEIFHVAFGARSGEVLGRGVLSQYGEWLAGVTAAEDYSRDVFAAGALPPAVLTSPSVATEVQAAELKAKWRDIVSTREPVILPSGTTLTPVVGNAEQAQLVQARTWNAQQVANIVGVPGWKLGLDGPSMTYQNIETGDIDFVRDSVDRYARPLAEAITKWLLPAGWEVVWDYVSRMRSDATTQANVLATLVGAGLVTVDEARVVLGRPPMPTADTPPPPPELVAVTDTPPEDVSENTGP
jgi:HK97 family phage portal protein